MSAAGICSFTPHHMHYEFTHKWDFYVSVTVEIVYMQTILWTVWTHVVYDMIYNLIHTALRIML